MEILCKKNWEYDKIKSILKENLCKVVFTKKDGSIRVMRCTLVNVVLENKKVEFKNNKQSVINKEFISVWDLEKDSWRRFEIDSLDNIEFVKFGGFDEKYPEEFDIIFQKHFEKILA